MRSLFISPPFLVVIFRRRLDTIIQKYVCLVFQCNATGLHIEIIAKHSNNAGGHYSRQRLRDDAIPHTHAAPTRHARRDESTPTDGLRCRRLGAIITGAARAQK